MPYLIVKTKNSKDLTDIRRRLYEDFQNTNVKFQEVASVQGLFSEKEYNVIGNVFSNILTRVKERNKESNE